MKFHENMSSGSHADTCGKTETDVAKLRETPCSYGNMPKNGWSSITTSPICLHGWTRTAVPLPFMW